MDNGYSVLHHQQANKAKLQRLPSCNNNNISNSHLLFQHNPSRYQRYISSIRRRRQPLRRLRGRRTCKLGAGRFCYYEVMTSYCWICSLKYVMIVLGLVSKVHIHPIDEYAVVDMLALYLQCCLSGLQGGVLVVLYLL